MATSEQRLTRYSGNSTPLFNLGRLLITPGARDALLAAGHNPADLLGRHVVGDWGDLDDADWRANDRALFEDTRIFSSYLVTPDLKVWVITEWDRSMTTTLLPSEY